MSDFLLVMITMVISVGRRGELWREDPTHGISSVWSFISICFGWWCSTYIPSLIHKNEHSSLLPSCSEMATKSDPKECWSSPTRMVSVGLIIPVWCPEHRVSLFLDTLLSDTLWSSHCHHALLLTMIMTQSSISNTHIQIRKRQTIIEKTIITVNEFVSM